MYIEELIPGVNLEDKNTEFKGIIKEGKDEKGKQAEIGWLKTLCAFANTDGGKLYVGVEDKTHKICALDHLTADQVIRMVYRQVKEKVEPGLGLDIRSIPVSGEAQTRYVIEISVSPGKNLPVALHEKGLLGIYIRNYGQTQTASPEQIRDLVLMSEQIPFDQSFTDEIYHPEDFSKLLSLVKERKWTISEKQLISIGFMSQDKHLSRGALLFKDNYSRQDTETVCTFWPQYTKGSDIVLAHQELKGNLLDIIHDAIAFVMDHSVNGFRKESTTRVAYYSYPERSVTEGIVNAVGHRNYFISGTQVEVNIFKDRLEITSPGSLLGVRNLQHETNIASIVPRRRNEVICAVLELCKYMEKKGSGFDKIEEDYQSADLNHKPYISADGSSFTLTLPDLTYQQGAISQNNDRIPEVYCDILTTGKNDLAILGFTFRQAKTIKEIAEYLSITPSTYFRKNSIARLVKAGLLIEHPGDRSAKYQSNHALVHQK
ncbi:MAG: ATP-binding protein [Lactimicrobium sp.]|jgi:ATP-dependent DNA helicase RecG|uniref:ATP-binding protein n=1 Tax=Lactimicrobium sp. TaxID=2563780 RepID=UPI002F356D07